MKPDLESWKPASWRKLRPAQQPEYEDRGHLEQVLRKVRCWPPLVYPGEIRKLRRELALVAAGRRFFLQGGDCAEKFEDCNQETITAKLKILLQMSIVLFYETNRPVVKIGRIAGQYAKPRSSSVEFFGNTAIPSYRGDNVNAFSPDPSLRKPDPERLATGQRLAALTLNYIRALSCGGFTDLRHPDNWNLSFASNSPSRGRYESIVNKIREAMAFAKTAGYQDPPPSRIDFYTSHEGLILPLEEAVTFHHTDGLYYNLGAHMLWIGDRTRQPDGAHIEYFRGIENPTGIKVGPDACPDEITETVRALNPCNEAGRIVLITRLGKNRVGELLPILIEKVSLAGQRVCWCCDPMHGNTIRTKGGLKTRSFDAILSELKSTITIHKEMQSHLGGVHFELTGENVTECTGGAEGITDQDLTKNYSSFCDPRLNYSQSLELAFLIAELL